MQPEKPQQGSRPLPKPPSVVLIIIQCSALAILFTGTGIVLATAITHWIGVG